MLSSDLTALRSSFIQSVNAGEFSFWKAQAVADVLALAIIKAQQLECRLSNISSSEVAPLDYGLNVVPFPMTKANLNPRENEG